MSLSARAFAIRLVEVPIAPLAATMVGAINSSVWCDLVMGFFGTLLFTFVSERILRGVLMGKIGSDALVWYTVQLIGETITIAAIGWVCGLAFNIAVTNTTLFWIVAAGLWLYLCWEMLGNIFRLLPLWLATRGGPRK